MVWSVWGINCVRAHSECSKSNVSIVMNTRLILEQIRPRRLLSQNPVTTGHAQDLLATLPQCAPLLAADNLVLLSQWALQRYPLAGKWPPCAESERPDLSTSHDPPCRDEARG